MIKRRGVKSYKCGGKVERSEGGSKPVERPVTEKENGRARGRVGEYKEGGKVSRSKRRRG